MCMYCEKGKSMCNSNIKDLGIELHSGTSKLVAYGLDEFGWDISVSCDIKYCPMCRKEAGRVKRYASGYWYQFIIPRRLTLPPVRIYRWLNFFWRLKDKEESYE